MLVLWSFYLNCSDVPCNYYYKYVYRRTSQSSVGGGGGEVHKMSGMEEGENWSKLCCLGGRVSTLVLILEGDI